MPLLVADGLNRVEVGGFACRVPTEEDTDNDAEHRQESSELVVAQCFQGYSELLLSAKTF